MIGESQAASEADAISAGERSFARYRAAVERTNALIEASPMPTGKTPTEIRARAEARLARVRRFLARLGNPHDAYPIVHVTGTSGKGSTAVMIAAILTAAGHKTGLHASPYVQAATEKLQVDGRLIAADAFADLVDDVLAEHEAWLRTGEEALTYGEVWMALLATCFARERVDLAVIEVGAGGRFDLTNVVRPAVAVITSVGLDHTQTLGETIAEIAWHKAGIIKPGAPVVTAVLDREAFAPIAAEAARAGVPLERVVPGQTYEVLAGGPLGARWRELGNHEYRDRVFEAAMRGRFQAANGALAVTAVRQLAARGFPVTDDAIVRGLRAARLPGRGELVQTCPRVVLDGAHNPQKVVALAADLPALLGAPSDLPAGKPIVVLGVLEAKDDAALVRTLAPHAAALILTTPRVLAKPGADAGVLAEVARGVGFAGSLVVEPEPAAALARALERAEATPGSAVLVTGSLYLVGNVRERWYREEAIVLQRTSWPE